MKSSRPWRYGILVLVVAFLGVGGTLIRSRWLASHDTRTPKEPASHTTHHSDTEATKPSTSSETIEFPRDLWDSAKLQVQVATQGPMTEAIELTGKVALNEDQLSHVFPLVEGRVYEVKVRLGQQVKKGDLLAIVQSKEVGQEMLQLFQDRLKLEFATAKDHWIQDVGRNAQSMIGQMREGATVESIEQSLKDRPLGDYREKLMTAYVASLKAKTRLGRLSPLTSSGAIPARQMLEVQAEVDATRATLLSLWEQIAQDTVQASRLSAQAIKELQTRIAISETNLKILGLEENDLKDIDPAVQGERLAHYPVTAPFDGTVISKDVVLLERVGPEQQILAIADLSTVWVTADIYETHLPLLSQLGDKTLRLRCEAWPDREFDARIFYTGDVVQESTRTVTLRATASNPEGLLKPGMFVTVILPSLETGAVVQVPLAALQDHEGQSFVFVQTGEDEFIRRDVSLGRRNHETVEVQTGVRAGDRVVVDGGFALKSKMLADLLAE